MFSFIFNVLKLVYVYLGFVFITLGCYLILFLRVHLLGVKASEFTKSCLAHETAALWGRALMWMVPGWSVELKGLENLPPKGKACVIVSNHLSNADIWTAFLLPLQFRWLSKASVFKLPLIGPSMRVAGYIPVERGQKESQMEAMQKKCRVAQKGCAYVFFSGRNTVFFWKTPGI